MKYQICWWNTGLSPPKGKSNDPSHLSDVIEKLKILEQKNIDLICLGEVDSSAIEEIRESNVLNRYEVFDRSVDQDGTKFNMAFANLGGGASLKDFVFITKRVRASKKKISQSFNVELSDGGVFRVFVVHWPSRLFVPEDANLRGSYGTLLRTSIDDLLDENLDEKIILLGDFNDEPYNDSIALEMSASRDVVLVQKNKRLLYNPFWRRMPPQGSYRRNSPAATIHGSYYYSSGVVHRWVVFDQVLVSSAFLGASMWHLDEDETIIWPDSEGFGVGPGKSKTIDHLPVIATLERE
jgi:hypothetical protein